MPAFLALPLWTLARLVVSLGKRLLAEIRFLRLPRQLPDATPAELGSLDENTFALITGKVRPCTKRLLEAPLSGRSCVWYSIDVIAINGDRFTSIGTTHEGITFLLDDATARAVVDPDRSRISVAFDHVTSSKAAFDADPQQRAVLERLGLIKRNWFLTEEVVYREAIIEVDDTLAIYGAGVHEPDPDAAPTGMYRDSGPQRLRFTGTAKYPLRISDDPRTL